jgi:predicted RNase H-like HicB family nuclease
VDIASQGSSPEESLANLQEALALYFEDPRPTITPDIKKIEVEIGAA